MIATFAYLTLVDGTLVDLELVDGLAVVVRAGRSLVPSERDEVLRLTGADLTALLCASLDLLARACREYRPDHNGECLNCDELHERLDDDEAR